MQAANYNLNSFINGKLFITENLEISETILHEFFELLPQVVVETEEECFSQLIKSFFKYQNCSEFFSWLSDYAKSTRNMHQMVKGIQELNFKDFELLFDYCLENLILHNIGFETAANEMRGQEYYHEDNLKAMVNLINAYYKMILINGRSKGYVEHRILKTVGISEDRYLLFWERYLRNEDALWRKYSLKLQNEINQKLELFIEAISEIEEDE